MERASKTVSLNDDSDYDPTTARLLAASAKKKKKPTFRIRRFGSGKPKRGSYLQRGKKA
jgi:hypothetical protein